MDNTGSAKTNSDRLRISDLTTWLHAITPFRFGVARLEKPFSMVFYDEWLRAGHHGEMSYLERHRDLKADPSTWKSLTESSALSAIVFAIDYVGPTDKSAKSDYVTENLETLRTALYTRYAPRNADYHHKIREDLKPVIEELSRRYPKAQFRLAIDAEPVLERDLATRSGLGWVGKNTCVIDRNGGSLFFIAEILTSLETDEAALKGPDFCGTCTRCLDSCPTGAIVEPRKLDATKCISYWTIESKTIAPRSLRDKFGDWFFGCDICQTVCPWNGKVFGRERMANETAGPLSGARSATARSNLVRELKFILESSNRELQRRFAGTPFERARGFGLKRNALVVAGNMRLTELKTSIESLLQDEKLGDLARETLTTVDLSL